ncbi:MAG: LuxR C-terminal-related transcriptional regulator [Balneolaceae bacterium]
MGSYTLGKTQNSKSSCGKGSLHTQPDEFTINEAELKKLNLSRREYKVLQLLAKGYRNAEIAKELFL